MAQPYSYLWIVANYVTQDKNEGVKAGAIADIQNQRFRRHYSGSQLDAIHVG
ncbi:MAG TPA: hypothetical protein V6D11_30165 [Waterburya sp.]